MRLAAIALAAAALVSGCNTVHRFRDDPIQSNKAPVKAVRDCSQGGVDCPPLNRRQYYDDKSARYYYFDPATGRYYWENGDPRF
jgi:hypothetical protein